MHDARMLLFGALCHLFWTSSIAFAEVRTLSYIHMAFHPAGESGGYRSVGFLGGRPFAHFSASRGIYERRDAWAKQLESKKDYWESEEANQRSQADTFRYNIATAMARFGHGAVNDSRHHTLQRMYGCEIDTETGAVTGYDRTGYDGKDFIALNLAERAWHAMCPEAIATKNKWDNKNTAWYVANYIENTCIDWLGKYYNEFGGGVPVAPEVVIFARRDRTIVCHATGFYPANITLSWVHPSMAPIGELGETLPNGDGTFQKRLVLTNGEAGVVCRVDHAALKDGPITIRLKGAIASSSSSAPIIAAGMGFVLAGCVAATYYYYYHWVGADAG